MNPVLKTVQHPRQAEIYCLEEACCEASNLLRTLQQMMTKHGETREVLVLEQDAKDMLSKLRKLLKATRSIDA